MPAVPYSHLDDFSAINRRELLVLGLGGTVAALARRTAAAEGSGKIVYSRNVNDRFDLHVMNADGSGDTLIPGQAERFNLLPTWSSKGQRIAYVSAADINLREAKLNLTNAEGKNAIAVEGGRGWFPAWSPDGKQLAFASSTEDDARMGVRLGGPNGEAARRFTDELSINPFFGPDGKHLFYTRFGDDGQTEIVRKPVTGGAQEVIVPVQKAFCGATPGALSPDGKQLLYMVVYARTFSATLRLRTLATDAERTVEDLNFEGGLAHQALVTACWSANGEWFVANLPSPNGMGVFRISADLKQRVRLTPENVVCVTPSLVSTP